MPIKTEISKSTHDNKKKSNRDSSIKNNSNIAEDVDNVSEELGEVAIDFVLEIISSIGDGL